MPSPLLAAITLRTGRVSDRNVLRVGNANSIVLIALGDQARGVGANQVALNGNT